MVRGQIERLARLVSAVTGRERIPVLTPFTCETLGTIPNCAPEDLQEAVRRARAAQPAWAATSFADRRAILLRFHDLLLDRREQVLDLIQLESGKARIHALEEVLDTALVARHYAVHAERYLRTERRWGALPLVTTVWEHRHPLGAVGVIAPFNFPLILGVTDLIPALMAGNCVVLRPDVQSSLSALWALDLLHQAGLPRELLQVVTGDGQVLGPALVDAVDYVMFTGSTKTGRVVGGRAAGRLIGFSLELGGKNPMIVLEDADIEAAVDGLVRGAFVGAGQVCLSIERAYIHSAVAADFTRRLRERVLHMKLSAELDYDADMGSLTTARQFAAVCAHVQDALSKGAVLLAGGRPRPDLGPLFYEPTVLSDVTPKMRVYAEETFGPVVSLYEYSAIEDAIGRANDTNYGLNASVWSKDVRRALEVAARIRAGSVNVNEVYGAAWSATSTPIGGMKESGFARRHGAEGILKYTAAQTVAAQRWLPLAPPRLMPQRRYAVWMPRLVRLLRHLPGLR